MLLLLLKDTLVWGRAPGDTPQAVLLAYYKLHQSASQLARAPVAWTLEELWDVVESW